MIGNVKIVELFLELEMNSINIGIKNILSIFNQNVGVKV